MKHFFVWTQMDIFEVWYHVLFNLTNLAHKKVERKNKTKKNFKKPEAPNGGVQIPLVLLGQWQSTLCNHQGEA